MSVLSLRVEVGQSQRTPDASLHPALDHDVPDHEVPDHEVPDQLVPDHEVPDLAQND